MRSLHIASLIALLTLMAAGCAGGESTHDVDSNPDPLIQRTMKIIEAFERGDEQRLADLTGRSPAELLATPSDPSDVAGQVWVRVLEGTSMADVRNLSFQVTYPSPPAGSNALAVVEVTGELRIDGSPWMEWRRAVTFEQINGTWELRNF